MDRKASIFFSLNDRASGYRYRTNLRRNVLASEYLIKRLKCEHVFIGHEGCVNTVAWNDCGDVLISGSDDCKLNIYKLTSMKPVQSIQSGHQANIFSAKFLPCTADTKIASCSGDGVLHYNDVNSHLSYGKNPFRCHTGTTYEVNTTPGDPHTFMSSGEDGTVRLFDIRSKTKCLCEGCKEDVLIDCKKAVTSFSVNPVQPYYVAVGSENSVLRVYDRRSLSAGDHGKHLDKQRGLLYQFKPKALEKRDCRVTSLKYSSNGRNLLASYCSDYVYLFDSNPQQTDHQLRSSREEENDGPCPNAGNDPPMKRLRLRGDWSDTGPNARPEGEESTTTEDSFVQRMSGYLTRWIEESLRSARRQRRRSPNVARRRTEDDQEESDDSSSSETVEDRSTALRGVNRDQQRTGTNIDDDVTESKGDVPENSNDNCDDVISNGSNVTDNRNDASQKVDKCLRTSQTLPHGTGETSERTRSNDIEHVQPAYTSRDSTEDTGSCVPDGTNIQSGTKNNNLSRTGLRKRNSSSDTLTTDDNDFRCHGENIESCGQTTSRDRHSGSHDNETHEGNNSNERGDSVIDKDPSEKKQSEVATLERSSMQSVDKGPTASDNEIPSEIITGEFDTFDSCTDQDSLLLDSQETQHTDFGKDESQTLQNLKETTPDGENNSLEDQVPVKYCNTRGNLPSGNETSNLRHSSTLGVSNRFTIPLGTNARKSESLSVDSNTGPSEASSGNLDRNVEESSGTVDSDSRRNAAASTIQNFFRFRIKKDFESISCDVPVHSEVKQVFKGHRNARTMIKEANFWGDEYVLSGSDCGRIFIWSRETAEVVMLLEGDRHVVNCVQPHPYMPIMATSGIDYDIKLWTPIALNVCGLENAQEVITRNERMLRESRDTLTVPASFMIRVLSSLHRVRFHGGGENQSSGDSDSDLDED